MSMTMDDSIKRWTAKRKTALVIEIIQRKTTVSEASRSFDLTPSEIEGWVEDAKRGMENSLRANPLDIREQYEKQLREALLRKSADDRTSPFPGHIYPATTVIGIPSAVNRLRTAARIWTSATGRSKSRDMSRWPSCFTQFIH